MAMKRGGYLGAADGFTIVELMIATAVFSLVLMVVLYGVLSFSHTYYRGVNSSTTQNMARTIINNVAQAIEFSGSSITATPASESAGNKYYFCAGGATYYYVLGALYDGTATASNPGLYVEPGTCTSVPPDFSNPRGTELLASNMRITYLSVQPSSGNPSLYTIGIGLAYGDSDLLCSKSLGTGAGGCASPADTASQLVAGTNPDDVACRSGTGYQFCAHAGLSTKVLLRVANGAPGS